MTPTVWHCDACNASFITFEEKLARKNSVRSCPHCKEPSSKTDMVESLSEVVARRAISVLRGFAKGKKGEEDG